MSHTKDLWNNSQDWNRDELLDELLTKQLLEQEQQEQWEMIAQEDAAEHRTYWADYARVARVELAYQAAQEEDEDLPF